MQQKPKLCERCATLPRVAVERYEEYRGKKCKRVESKYCEQCEKHMHKWVQTGSHGRA